MGNVDTLTYAINGLAMKAHSELGPGLDEQFYHALLSEKLKAAGIEHLFRPREALMHRGHVADYFEADLVFPERAIAELKRLWGSFVPENYTQVYCYLKFWKIGTGLLFDFGKESLIHERVLYSPAVWPPATPKELVQAAPEFVTDRALALHLCESIIRVGETHGLGYRDTTYRGLLSADFSAEGVGHIIQPVVNIGWDGHLAGQARLECLAVENRCAVLVLAIRDRINAADRARLQTYLRHLDVPWGLIIHFGKRNLELRWVARPRTR